MHCCTDQECNCGQLHYLHQKIVTIVGVYSIYVIVGVVVMPRDILSDSLAVLSIVEHEDEESWPLEDKPSSKVNKKLSNTPLKRPENNKDDCACYYNYGLGEAMQSRQQDPLYTFKTCSLPPSASMNQNWDEIICSALRISPEDIANQLTLLDLPCFKAIQPEELTTCGFNKKNKATASPNVVAFTKRFNRVSFWTVQEILNGESPKARAEILAHFIKVAKKLHELNNLHSLFAIVSALNSASIYRLNKTWASLSKKDKQQFDKLAELFSENDNFATLREYLHNVTLPCIPYLGLFLTDLVYIDLAHGASDSPHRAAKMGMVLQVLQRYQTSEYDITPLSYVANYLNSVRYIEELQKFLEDDHYKLSLKLEPQSPIGSCAGSKESIKDMQIQGTSTPYSLSPSHRLGSGSFKIHNSQLNSKFIPTHRKCRSLGTNIFGKGYGDDKSEEKTPAGSVNLLDDTLLESPGSVNGEKTSQSMPNSYLQDAEDECDHQGFVRRKTISKDGRKISLSSWQRYWLEMSGNLLIFYASKSFKGTARSDFRTERCKVLPLDGWLAIWDAGSSPDAFLLHNRTYGTSYKFKTGSEFSAKMWVRKIEEVTNKIVKPFPANLMSFE